MELVVLSSDSNTRNGCDRVILADDRVVVHGEPVLGNPDFSFGPTRGDAECNLRKNLPGSSP